MTDSQFPRSHYLESRDRKRSEQTIINGNLSSNKYPLVNIKRKLAFSSQMCEIHLHINHNYNMPSYLIYKFNGILT